MAASHFSEPQINIASQLWVLLLTVHVAAQMTLLNCYLQIASGVIYVETRAHVLSLLWSGIHSWIHRTWRGRNILLFDFFYLLRLFMLPCFNDFLENIFPENESRDYFCQAGQWVDISPRVSVRWAASADDDDVYLAGISKHSTLPLVGSSISHLSSVFALWHNCFFIFSVVGQ